MLEALGGPYVQAALFCEKLLVEQNGMLSIIRVIDQITHTVQGTGAPDAMPAVQFQLQGVVMLKPGDARGRVGYTLAVERPDGLRREIVSGSVHFAGGAGQGVNLPLNLSVAFEQEGVYWFDLAIEGRTLTRMPFTVLYNRIVPGPTPAPGG